MTVAFSLVAVGGVLFAVGTALLLTRSLTRILLGAVLVGNGVNVLFLSTTGRTGDPPLLYPGTDPGRVTDPLPQAMALTAIVITLSVTAFLLAMVYRSWQLNGSDEVQDDIEDRRVALRAEETAERARLRDEYRKYRRQYATAARGTGGEGPARARALRARAEYEQSRTRLRRRLRADRVHRSDTTDATADLWDHVLGEDR
ncbi:MULTISPECIES: Na(+)/H(+) antiporter subunit C [Streptomyces]|uniref:Na(+)/H(+) antiporter subunit C n=1 Tax=Streptomyces lycii TaxID=2654337 RepID=A0ABQ7FP46_9ACTN|nr:MULTISPECIES: Na(+)/H(+) antiporter subunit C [Streptomyces]KAF4409768.1 Na(+)/H(+) antiporter subunit C [Streptomyces lycii]PGH47870.1 Na(+)/H(+) antiporter subunit C [Streptomyces sp. Ru87]